MKKYKILKKIDDIYYSPFQNYKYGRIEDFIGKEMVLDNFDDNKDIECSRRYYATDIEGLIYTNLSGNKVVFEMDMNGKSIISSTHKQGFEKQTFIREIHIDEVKELVKEASNKMDWNYYDMMFPLNPLNEIKEANEDIIRLLKNWASVCDSFRCYSVRASVKVSVCNSFMGSSVWASVCASVCDSFMGSSVWASVRASVCDSVCAYISYGFPNIKKWKYIEHEEGINPYQSCIDLWNKGFVPSFDGETWRLHSGKKAKIVFEIYKEDLIK